MAGAAEVRPGLLAGCRRDARAVPGLALFARNCTSPASSTSLLPDPNNDRDIRDSWVACSATAVSFERFWPLFQTLISGAAPSTEAARRGCCAGWQAEAFAWLGRFYGQQAGDAARARKCYQRALALDPLQGLAGDAGSVFTLSGSMIWIGVKVCQKFRMSECQSVRLSKYIKTPKYLRRQFSILETLISNIEMYPEFGSALPKHANPKH